MGITQMYDMAKDLEYLLYIYIPWSVYSAPIVFRILVD